MLAPTPLAMEKELEFNLQGFTEELQRGFPKPESKEMTISPEGWGGVDAMMYYDGSSLGDSPLQPNLSFEEAYMQMANQYQYNKSDDINQFLGFKNQELMEKDLMISPDFKNQLTPLLDMDYLSNSEEWKSFQPSSSCNISPTLESNNMTITNPIHNNMNPNLIDPPFSYNSSMLMLTGYQNIPYNPMSVYPMFMDDFVSTNPHHNSFDPIKVKRHKNVGRACTHCKKAHLACDESRPCKRCTHLGKQNCIDVQHKRRGRPKTSSSRPSE